MDTSTSVLIVGGSLNGLTMAMLLARRRVPCSGSRAPSSDVDSVHVPGIAPRSMEILRRAGVADVALLATQRGSVTRFPALKVQPNATGAELDDLHPDGADYATRESCNGIQCVPDQVRSRCAAMTRLPAIDRPPAKPLDEALQAIGGRYGAHTTDFVAMQLEYPTELRRAVCERANAFGQTAMTRSLR